MVVISPENCVAGGAFFLVFFFCFSVPCLAKEDFFAVVVHVRGAVRASVCAFGRFNLSVAPLSFSSVPLFCLRSLRVQTLPAPPSFFPLCALASGGSLSSTLVLPLPGWLSCAPPPFKIVSHLFI